MKSGAACTLLMRALPFTLLGKRQEIPEVIRYLGNILPAAIMAVLIVYCLKSVPMDFGGTGMYQLLAAGVCVLLHVWKKNTLFKHGILYDIDAVFMTIRKKDIIIIGIVVH